MTFAIAACPAGQGLTDSVAINVNLAIDLEIKATATNNEDQLLLGTIDRLGELRRQHWHSYF